MKLVGFHYNRSPLDRSKRFSPSLINRVALIDQYLQEAGLRLFVHAPQNISPTEDRVDGWIFENRTFVPTTAELPLVNGNWTHRTRRLLEQHGMGYERFGVFARERGLGIYVPHAFSELLGNKHETYKLIRAFNDTLHPRCEIYARSVKQLEHFVDTGPLTFLKPCTGSKGNKIITIRRDDTGLRITHYDDGERKQQAATSLRGAVELVGGLIEGERKYVIQHGVETLRHEGSTFDIRVTMLHDGRAWSGLHEVRLSPAGSDVSNVRQGGETVVTEDLLFHVMGPEAAEQTLADLMSESHGLAEYLERLHPGDILEVAFDFVIDREGRLRLLEVNTKPGLAGIGADISIYDKRPEHEAGFERWVYPHTRSLARFLMRKSATRT